MGSRIMRMSKEDYLEAVLICTKRFGTCRVTDIAKQLGHSKASVSVALTKLEKEGLIKKDDWRILLSDSGRSSAEKIFERHLFFLKWFEHIGIDTQIANEDACLIEHAISDTTFEKIMDYLKKHDSEL